MASAARRGQSFRTDVQGLRAIAVSLVLAYHAGIPRITGGYVGVDVFFVISGFLISTHLLQALERDGRIRFAEFYARRIRRILPASLTVAVLTGIASILFYPPLALERVLRDALATILYMPNVWFAIQDTDYLADPLPALLVVGCRGAVLPALASRAPLDLPAGASPPISAGMRDRGDRPVQSHRRRGAHRG